MVCNKITYNTRKEARDASAGVSSRHKQSMYVYQCESCGKYHLATHGKGKKKKGVKMVTKKEKYRIDLSAVRYKVPEAKKQKQPRRIKPQRVETKFKMMSEETARRLKAKLEKES